LILGKCDHQLADVERFAWFKSLESWVAAPCKWFHPEKNVMQKGCFDVKLLEIPVERGSKVEHSPEGLQASGWGSGFVIVNARLQIVPPSESQLSPHVRQCLFANASATTLATLSDTTMS
jgi:hypothetical protein